mmetsp:Transcript_77003/g.150855  ORF Transcript_77003/g.150855 Transcript_77003/m.150855 type:complete len:247 (+) Transcript_77003:146-886(+)
MSNVIMQLAQTVVSAGKQGASYGARIRLPHAFVMTILFQKGSWEYKVRRIVEMTLVHGKNLAMYAATYKAVLAILRTLSLSPSPSSRPDSFTEPGRPIASWHPLVAGGVGGYLVWGNYSGVNYQISLYVLSRVMVASARLLAESKVEPFKSLSFQQVYPWGTAATWSAVMYLWEYHPRLLQPSLKASMDFIYRDGDRTVPWRKGLGASLAAAAPSAPFIAVLAASAAFRLLRPEQPPPPAPSPPGR